MSDQSKFALIEVPRDGVNDDAVRVIEWLVDDGGQVAAGDVVVVVETTKSVIDLASGDTGFLFQLAEAGSDVPVGSAVGLVAPTPYRPDVPELASSAQPLIPKEDQLITAKAKLLLAEHNLPVELFADHQVVRTADIEEYLRRSEVGSQARIRTFDGSALDQDADWDAILDDAQYRQLKALLTALRKRMKARFNRHVSTTELLHDRWELAAEFGFGAGTSVYDDSLILGEVMVGENCWVGPQCVLDGSGGLVIGDNVDVGAGSQIYSHNTIERALTRHQAPIFHKPTRIGSRCFIGPRSIIAPGTVIGDQCFVAVGSYVEGIFPEGSYISGNPAKRVGTVDVKGSAANVRLFKG